jgi:hypothetical protein
MADKNKIAEMLEHIVNNDTAKAEEIFHNYVVEKSREIYENLIESELEEEDLGEEDDEENDDMDESFEDVEMGEADDETDDMIDDMEGDDEGGEEGEENPFGDEEGEEGHDEDAEATKGDIKDLASAIDELQAAFDQFLQGEQHEEETGEPGDHAGHMDAAADALDGSEEFETVEDLDTVREYVEKVGNDWDKNNQKGEGKAVGAQSGSVTGATNTKSTVAGKNDMGGTTANIAKGGEGGGSETGLSKNKPQDMNTGNINVPGGKAGSAFSKKEPGHGAEKKGSGESADNTASLFRGKK